MKTKEKILQEKDKTRKLLYEAQQAEDKLKALERIALCEESGHQWCVSAIGERPAFLAVNIVVCACTECDCYFTFGGGTHEGTIMFAVDGDSSGMGVPLSTYLSTGDEEE